MRGVLMEPKISIVVPIFNTGKYLTECLDSIYKQSIKELEIICIDDGSTDDTPKILERYSKADPRIRILTQKNQGVSVARNLGIATATGEYIQFLDSDDMLEPWALEYAVQQMTEKKLDVFYFDAQAIFESAQLEEEKRVYKTYYHRENGYQNVQTGCQLFTTLTKDGAFRPNGNLQMIRRNFLLQCKVRYIPGIVQEDNAFTAEVMLHAQRVCHENKPLYIRRLRPGSIMTNPPAFSNAYGYFRCAMALEKYFFKPNFSKNSQSALQIFCQSLVQNMEIIYRNIPEEEKEKIKSIPQKERGAMLYLCWYSEQVAVSKKEKNKINVEYRVMQNDKAVLVKQNEEIQHQNTAYQQQLVATSNTLQRLRQTLENETNAFAQKLKELSQDREILQRQLSDKQRQYEKAANKNSAYQEQIKKQEAVIQELNEKLQNEKKIFTRNYQEVSADKQKLQKQFSSLEKQAEEIRLKNMVYQQQMAEQSKVFHTLQADFFAMQQSLSFRVGRKLTWLPRKIRDAFFR